MRKKSEKVADDLAKVVRGDVFADVLHRVAYSTDASIYRVLPECVVAPCDLGDIVAVVKYAAAKAVPVVARGAGSGVAGESLCSGIVFDMTRYMNRIISVEDDGSAIVCEPSAALCLRDELRHFVSGEDAKLVSQNTYELMNYLYGLYKEGKLKPVRNDTMYMSLRAPASSCQKTGTGAWQSHPPKQERLLRRPDEIGTPRNDGVLDFVYHLPCHLSAVGDKQASVKLLRELCGLEIIELKAGCCGLAGTFGMQKKNYELSSQIAARLKEALEKSPIKNVLTECAACKMQIEHISDKIVRHPVKVLSEAYS